MTCPVCQGNHFVRFEDGSLMSCSKCASGGRMEREEILDEARELISGPRHKEYGNAKDNFRRIAVGWSEIFGTQVTLAQVALAMDWVKSARLIETPGHRDSWVDKAGYTALGWEVSDV